MSHSTSSDDAFMPSVRLTHPNWEDPVYLEEVLSDGGIKEWIELYRLVSQQPFGSTAQALEQILNGVHIYGAVPLWKSVLQNLRDNYKLKNGAV